MLLVGILPVAYCTLVITTCTYAFYLVSDLFVFICSHVLEPRELIPILFFTVILIGKVSATKPVFNKSITGTGVF